jgi:hypothetical protein
MRIASFAEIADRIRDFCFEGARAFQPRRKTTQEITEALAAGG